MKDFANQSKTIDKKKKKKKLERLLQSFLWYTQRQIHFHIIFLSLNFKCDQLSQLKKA